MARPLRIEFPGALYHVMARGNARQDIAVDDEDRVGFVRALGDAVLEHGWLCHAYCLMPNHYHLLLATPQPNLSRGMRQLNGIYTQRFNRRRRRVGHLFQGRYRAIVVERETHLVTLARYIVLNPVRAGITDAPEAYRWSSLPATVGLSFRPAWLSCEAVVQAFGSTERYRAFVHEGVANPPARPSNLVDGLILGSPDFVRSHADRLAAKSFDAEYRRSDRHAARASLAELLPPEVVVDKELRDQRIRAARRNHAYTNAEIARHLGLHYVTISQIVAAQPLRPAARAVSAAFGQLPSGKSSGAVSGAGRAEVG